MAVKAAMVKRRAIRGLHFRFALVAYRKADVGDLQVMAELGC